MQYDTKKIEYGETSVVAHLLMIDLLGEDGVIMLNEISKCYRCGMFIGFIYNHMVRCTEAYIWKRTGFSVDKQKQVLRKLVSLGLVFCGIDEHTNERYIGINFEKVEGILEEV